MSSYQPGRLPGQVFCQLSNLQSSAKGAWKTTSSTSCCSSFRRVLELDKSVKANSIRALPLFRIHIIFSRDKPSKTRSRPSFFLDSLQGQGLPSQNDVGLQYSHGCYGSFSISFDDAKQRPSYLTEPATPTSEPLLASLHLPLSRNPSKRWSREVDAFLSAGISHRSAKMAWIRREHLQTPFC